MAYVAPLRVAAAWLLRRARPFDLDGLAQLAGVDRRRACAYATVLVALRAAIARDGLLTPGPRFAEWEVEVPRSRPGGTAVSYLRARREREIAHPSPAAEAAALRAFAAAVRERRSQRGLTQAQLAARASLHRCDISDLERGVDFPGAAALRRIAVVLGLEDQWPAS